MDCLTDLAPAAQISPTIGSDFNAADNLLQGGQVIDDEDHQPDGSVDVVLHDGGDAADFVLIETEEGL